MCMISGLTLALSDSEDESEDEDISDADRFKALQEATFRQRAEGGQDDSSDDEDDDESEQGEVICPPIPSCSKHPPNFHVAPGHFESSSIHS